MQGFGLYAIGFLGEDFDYEFGCPRWVFNDGMFEDCGGAADGFVDGGGLHVDGVVYATAIPEGNFAVLDWQGSAFAVEEGEGIVAWDQSESEPLGLRVTSAACGTRR